MRYSFFCFPMIFLTPILSGAISLADIQNSPSTYIDVSNNQEVFVDVTSIQSTRYVPPYYTLEAEVYSVSGNSILESHYSVGYNYERSYEGIKDHVTSNYPNLTDAERARQLNVEIQNNTGMYCTIQDVATYNLQGDLLNQVEGNYYRQDIAFMSPSYYIGNYLFYRYYNQFFLPNERY